MVGGQRDGAPNQTLAQILSRSFNPLGRLTALQGAQSDDVTRFDYDDNGNETTAQTPLHAQASVSRYDALNRLVASIDPANGQVGYRCDAQDNLRQVTDPRNLSTSCGYNGFNELTALSSPDSGGTVYTYDMAALRSAEAGDGTCPRNCAYAMTALLLSFPKTGSPGQ